MKNMLIAQSGGPTAAINASLAGAVEQAMKCGQIDKIYGARNGIEGALKEHFVEFHHLLHTEEDFLRLKQTPAMALGSCRKRLSQEPDKEYEQLLDIFRRMEIRYFFYIGGNDSMDTVDKLDAYFKAVGEDIRVVGIPKTIDNDLACTDHSPGFGSAARFVATSVAEIACDSEVYDTPSITVVEIMGRNAGWLTASSVLARREGCDAPHLLLLPECPFEEEAFLQRVAQLRKTHQHLVIAVSEGICHADGSYVSQSLHRTDAFGHSQLSGVGQYLRDRLMDAFGCKVRSVELNVLQRAAAHLQSETDIREASLIGAAAVSMAVKGKSGVMASLERVSSHPYLVRCGVADIRQVANVERHVPKEMIANMDVTDSMVEYLRPLIQNPSQKEPGIPHYFQISAM